MSAPSQAPRGRQIVFAVLALFILLGPAYRSTVSGAPPRHMRWLRGWAMYTRLYHVCVVRYVRHDDGQETEVDRYQALRLSDHGGGRTDVRLLENVAAVRALGERLCRATGARDLRAHARCSTLKDPSGWAEALRAEENLCR